MALQKTVADDLELPWQNSVLTYRHIGLKKNSKQLAMLTLCFLHSHSLPASSFLLKCTSKPWSTNIFDLFKLKHFFLTELKVHIIGQKNELCLTRLFKMCIDL